MVFAPEHPLVNQVTTPEQKEAVQDYQKQTAGKSDLDRTDFNKEKTGVFTGAYAINPVNEQKIPDLDFRLCSDGLWNRSYHGCSCS